MKDADAASARAADGSEHSTTKESDVVGAVLHFVPCGLRCHVLCVPSFSSDSGTSDPKLGGAFPVGTPAFNVGRTYAAFAADIDNGKHSVPDFADAVRRHETIAAIDKSAASGERVKVYATG